MRHGIVLFTCDRGITPAEAAKAAEDRGFDAFYVPEHTQIPVRREAPHPGTGGGRLPDDRYREAWAAEGRPGQPDIRVLIAAKPSPCDLDAWAAAGATECIWGLPDGPAGEVEAYLDRRAARLGI